MALTQNLNKEILPYYKAYSLKAIRISSFFFGVFSVVLMVIHNLKVFEKLTPEKSLSPFLKTKYPKSYNNEIIKSIWIYGFCIFSLEVLVAVFIPNIPNAAYIAIAPAFGEFIYNKYLKKNLIKYITTVKSQSVIRIIWTGIKGMLLSLVFVFSLVRILFLIGVNIPE
jgi:hypothetical protein